MRRYLAIINYHTLLTLATAYLTIYLAYKYELVYRIDLTLISIAIIFPLVFAIRGSFRRREKALEHLSQFRSALKTLECFINSTDELSEEHKRELLAHLVSISNDTIKHLELNDSSTIELDQCINKVYIFMTERQETISRSLRDRIFRYMNKLQEAIDNLRAINIHRTPISLKAYCIVFIYLFPLIYTPTIISDVGLDKPIWVTYFIVFVSEFILISLYNIQDQLEFPFDNVGMDDIKLENFKIDR